MKKFLAAWLLLSSAASAAVPQNGVHRFYGYAYELKSNKYLYTEVHAQTVVGGKWTGGTIAYFDPAGEKVGFKTLDFSNDPLIPVYRLDLPHKGYFESITANGATIEMKTRSAADAKERTAAISKTGTMAADSGFHAILVENFPSLLTGKPFKFRLVVAGNLDSYKFKAVKTGDTVFDGKPSIKLRVEADSLLSFIADPLDLIYDIESRQLLEYRGISNLHDPASGKPYDVRIVYLTAPPPDAPKALPPLQ